MKIFLKWLLRTSILLIGISLITILTLTDDFDNSRIPKIILVLVGGILFLSLFFYLLEVKIIPWRIKKLNQKIIRTFDATEISTNCARFTLGSYEFYSVIHISLTLSQYGGGREFIHFHIPKNQIDSAVIKPKFKLKNSNVNGIETYIVFETNGLGINFAKKRIENKIK
ncbi:MAG: hypothetical protein ACPGVD_01580 [Flavobacteriales bacterium]